MAGQDFPWEANHTFCVIFLFLSKIVIWDDFGSKYARKAIKGYKDAGFTLVSVETWTKKMARWVGA